MDILLDNDFNLKFRNGDFVVGNSLLQDIGIILRLSPGDLKSDPILGPGLMQFQKSNVRKEDIMASIRRHIQRDNKDWDTVKELIKSNLQTL